MTSSPQGPIISMDFQAKWRLWFFYCFHFLATVKDKIKIEVFALSWRMTEANFWT